MFARSHAKTSTRTVFYGWRIVASGAITQALSAGFLYYGFGAFFLPLAQEFNVNRTAITGAVSFARLESSFLGPVEGYAIDKLGPKKVAILGVLLLGSGFFVLSKVSSLVSFYVVFILMVSLGSSLGFGTPFTTAIANWFVRRRSLALGIAMAGFGVGGVMVPLVALLIGRYGWRETSMIAGVVCLGVGIPAALVLKQRPEQLGLTPDGERTPDPSTHSLTPGTEIQHSDFRVAEALRTRAFWFLTGAFVFRTLASSVVAVHIIPLLTDKGYSTALGASVVGAIGISGTVGRVLVGWLGDAVSKRHLLAIVNTVTLVSMVVLLFARNPVMVFAFAVLYGPSIGVGGVMMALRGDYFGRKHFATIGGFQASIMTLGQVAGPILAAAIFDATKSYEIALYALVVLLGLSGVLIMLATPPKLRPTMEMSPESRTERIPTPKV